MWPDFVVDNKRTAGFGCKLFCLLVVNLLWGWYLGGVSHVDAAESGGMRYSLRVMCQELVATLV